MATKNIESIKKKSKTKYDIAYICMLIVAGLIIIGTGTYAYYRSTMTGATSGTIAKWSFTANNQASTFNLDLGKVYPGKTGTYNIELSAENSDLPIIYYMVFNYPNMITNLDDFSMDVVKQSEVYASLNNFYFDSSYNFGVQQNYFGVFGIILDGEKMTLPLYYNWPYNSDNIAVENEIQDIAGGNSTNDKITIVARQLDKASIENMDTSMDTFINEFLDMSSCSNGEYTYPNKYGYPCGILNFLFSDEIILSGEDVNYQTEDGDSTNVPKYLAQLLQIGEIN